MTTNETRVPGDFEPVVREIDDVVITFVDVTDLRAATAAQRRSESALAQSEERLEFALRSAPIVIIGHAPDGDATWGYAMGTELGGAKVLELFAPGHAERYTAVIREALADRSARRIELDLVVDGLLRTYDFRIEVSETGAHSIGFDITPSKLAEIALVDADRRKDEFLATLSHELRNPLTPLKVALDVMRISKDPTQLSRSREIMGRQVAMIERLVNELLDLSRITLGRITLDRQPIGVTELVEAALEVTRPSIVERGHRLQVHLPESAALIVGDRGRLIQVLTNLLGNAVKYTPPGGDIELVVSVDAKRKRLVIHLRDTGMGIAPEMLTRIFDIFVQSRDAQARSQGGLGIGLNLVRRLVALHGGTVIATSDGLGRGSEFVVELPLP